MSLLRVLILLWMAAPALSQPTLGTSPVVNGATFNTPVSPGSLVSIFGSGLAPTMASASTIPLPLMLAGVVVQFNGVSAPLLYVSPTQINAQLPWEIAANASVTITVSNNMLTSAPQSVAIGPFSPGIFATGNYAIAIHQDSTLATPPGAPFTPVNSHPASPEETLEVPAPGLGPTDPPGITGTNSLGTQRITSTTPTVRIGGVPAQVTFSGLSPQFVGVDQLNVVVPANVSAGSAVPIQIQTGGLTSTIQTAIAIGDTNWSQWMQNPQHTGNIALYGQSLNQILANTVYD